MNEYRKEAKQVLSDTWWTLPRVLAIVIVAVVVLAVVGFALNSAGLIGKTKVERAVFENSDQRIESIQTQIETLEAQQVEVKAQLRRTDLNESTKANLEAQAATLRVQIDAAKRRLGNR